MIEIVRVEGPTAEVRGLISGLEAVLSAGYPPEQRHGLSLAALFEPHVRFFVARRGGAAIGCGGVALFEGFAEVKRMFVVAEARGSGVVQALLERIDAEAREAGLGWLRLETGDKQGAAISAYKRAGFVQCGAFGAYAAMAREAVATSVFMEKRVAERVAEGA